MDRALTIESIRKTTFTTAMKYTDRRFHNPGTEAALVRRGHEAMPESLARERRRSSGTLLTPPSHPRPALRKDLVSPLKRVEDDEDLARGVYSGSGGTGARGRAEDESRRDGGERQPVALQGSSGSLQGSWGSGDRDRGAGSARSAQQGGLKLQNQHDSRPALENASGSGPRSSSLPISAPGRGGSSILAVGAMVSFHALHFHGSPAALGTSKSKPSALFNDTARATAEDDPLRSESADAEAQIAALTTVLRGVQNDPGYVPACCCDSRCSQGRREARQTRAGCCMPSPDD